MPSYTVSKNGYGTVTGSFTWVDSNINVSLKPANLYAWICNPTSKTKYYAWKTEDSTQFYYTLSETPAQYANKYVYSNGIMTLDQSYNDIREYDGSTTPPRILIRNTSTSDIVSFYMYRNVFSDIEMAGNGIDLPCTFYTDTDNPTTASVVYDIFGNDITTAFVHGAARFSQASSSSMTWYTSEPF